MQLFDGAQGPVTIGYLLFAFFRSPFSIHKTQDVTMQLHRIFDIAKSLRVGQSISLETI